MEMIYLEGGPFDGNWKKIGSGYYYVVMPVGSFKGPDSSLMGGFLGNLIAEASGELYRRTDRKHDEMTVFAYAQFIRGPITTQEIKESNPAI